MKKVCSLMVIIFIFSNILIADTIYMKKGTIVKGTILSSTNDTVTIKTASETYETLRSEIERIEPEPKQQIVIVKEYNNLGLLVLSGVAGWYTIYNYEIVQITKEHDRSDKVFLYGLITAISFIMAIKPTEVEKPAYSSKNYKFEPLLSMNNIGFRISKYF